MMIKKLFLNGDEIRDEYITAVGSFSGVFHGGDGADIGYYGMVWVKGCCLCGQSGCCTSPF